MLGKEQAGTFCCPGKGRQVVRRFLPLFLLLFVSACATSGDFELLRQDVNNLKRESFETKKEIDSLKEKTVGTVKEDSFTAVRESQAEISSRLSEIAQGLQELRGRFEENKYFFEKTLKDSASERELLKSQITGIENQIKTFKDKFAAIESQMKAQELSNEQPVSAKTDSGQTDKSEQKQDKVIAKKDTPDDKTKAYESAYQAFKDKKYKEAREKFEAFIKDYPKNELTDNAQFWIAETYYSEKDYEGAILAYETLLKKYPESEKTSGALLKQGLAFIDIGDKKTGRIILQKLIEKFPDSKDAELAKKKLAETDNKENKKPGKKK